MCIIFHFYALNLPPIDVEDHHIQKFVKLAKHLEKNSNVTFMFQTGVFDWSRDLQGILLSYSSYGYATMMPFGGIVVNIRTTQSTLQWCSNQSCVHSSNPRVALLSPYVLIVVEVIKGLATVRGGNFYSKQLKHRTLALPLSDGVFNVKMSLFTRCQNIAAKTYPSKPYPP